MIIICVLVCIISIIVFPLFLIGDNFIYNIFVDRVLIRTRDLFSEFQYCGHEIGGINQPRNPGGFLYYYLAIPMIFSNNPMIAYYFHLLLVTGSLFFFYLTMKKYYGIIPALFSVIILINSKYFLRISINVFFESAHFEFMLISFSLLIRYIKTQKNNYLRWLVFFLICLVQIQSFTIHILITFIVFILFARYLSKELFLSTPNTKFLKEIIICLLIAFILYLPYITIEFKNGFPNTMKFVNNALFHSFDNRDAFNSLGERFIFAKKTSWNFILHYMPGSRQSKYGNSLLLIDYFINYFFVFLLFISSIFITVLYFIQKNRNILVKINKSDILLLIFMLALIPWIIAWNHFRVYYYFGGVTISFSILIGMMVHYLEFFQTKVFNHTGKMPISMN